MEQPPSHHLKLGDELNATVVKPIGGSRYQLRCRKAPAGFTVTLQTLRNEEVEEGHHSTFWVAKIVPVRGEILVREGDYGRLPISESMAPRYLAAVRAMTGQAGATADILGDARSMVARISTQNHADWLTVWRVLGEPTAGDGRRLLQLIDNLRAALKESQEAVEQVQATINNEYGFALAGATKRLAKLVAQAG